MASSGNFSTLNPLGAQGGGTIDIGTLSNGNLSVACTDTAFGTIGVTSGKWYWEFRMVSSGVSGTSIGWANQQVNSEPELGYNSPASATGAQLVYMYAGSGGYNQIIVSNGPASGTTGSNADVGTIAQNDIMGIAADFDNDKWYFSINGSFDDMRSGQNPSTGSSPMCSASGGGGLQTIARTAGYTWFPAIGNWAAPTRDYTVNFGQDDTFGGAISAEGNADGNGHGVFKYSVPTGFLALCSANLPISDDIDPAQTDDDYPGKQFNVATWTGNSTNDRAISLDMAPDLVMIKERGAANNWYWYDSNRGASVGLFSNLNQAEATDTSELKSFTSTGFTLGTGGGTNNNNDTYCGWGWRANGGTTTTDTSGDISTVRQSNTASGFAILTWSGNGSNNQRLPHGLGKKPAFVIAKRRDAAQSWGVWTQYLGDNSKELQLDSDSAEQNSSNAWYQSGMTTDFVGIGSDRNISSSTNVAYVWADVEGMQKFGIYEGNGNADGTFVYTGFRPRMVFCKNTESSEAWVVADTARSTSNVIEKIIKWNNSNTEASGSTYAIDIVSNGFKIRTSWSGWNQSGKTLIYGAWGDVPFKYNNTF